MELKDIQTFQDMENYILERNRTIDCFDSLILQYLIQNMQEHQLVLIPKKDYFREVSIEQILTWYRPYIQNKYSLSLPILKGFISDHNEIWFRIPSAKEIPYSFQVQKRISKLTDDYYVDEDAIIWKQEWISIRDSRLENKINILYEDDCILIFVIIIKVDKIKNNNQTLELEFIHPIYRLNLDYPWQIFLADHYYHHYRLQRYDELEAKYGKDYIKQRLIEKEQILEFYRQELKLERKKGELLYGNHVFKDKS